MRKIQSFVPKKKFLKMWEVIALFGVFRLSTNPTNGEKSKEFPNQASPPNEKLLNTTLVKGFKFLNIEKEKFKSRN